MPRDIPGFVYDEARGKYFRVQENHRHTQHVATRSHDGRQRGQDGAVADRTRPWQPTVAYTREAVEGQKRLRLTQPKSKRHKGDAYPPSGRDPIKVCRARPLSGEIELQLRLRTHPYRHTTATTDVAALIKHRYATALEPRPLTGRNAIGSSGIFVIDKSTKELFTTAQLGRGRGEEFCVTPLYPSDAPQGPDATVGNHRHRTSSDSDAEPRYNKTSTIPILDSNPLTTAAVLSPGCVIWTTRTHHQHHHQPGGNAADLAGTSFNVSTRYASVGLDVPWHRWRDQFGEWGTQTTSLQTQLNTYDVAVAARGANSSASHSAEGPTVVFGTSQGVVLRDSAGGLKIVDATRPARRDDLDGAGEEVVSVGWKDERVWLAGRRDGRVLLGDTRVPDAVVGRLSVGNGGVSRVTGAGRRIDWGILTWGLRGAAVYDLRWCKDEALDTKAPGAAAAAAAAGAESDLDTTYHHHHHHRPHNGKYPRGNNKRPRRTRPPKSTTTTAAAAATTTTQPLLTFQIPDSHQQRQYGMGWSHDPDMGVVASAFPTFLGGSKVALWDVQTGKILDDTATRTTTVATAAAVRKSRQLGSREFTDLVRCLQFVDLERGLGGGGGFGGDDWGGGGGGGMKSLVVATGGALECWEV